MLENGIPGRYHPLVKEEMIAAVRILRRRFLKEGWEVLREVIRFFVLPVIVAKGTHARDCL
jgi:hypothetical protein